MTSRMSHTSITDRRVHDDSDLPDVPPGAEYARVITPQKFVVLHQIVIHGPILVGLRIGALSDVPFELESVDGDGDARRYRPKGLDGELIKKQLVKVGAAAAGPNAIAIAPGLEVRLQLRNEGDAPTKPRVALLVQEETCLSACHPRSADESI